MLGSESPPDAAPNSEGCLVQLKAGLLIRCAVDRMTAALLAAQTGCGGLLLLRLLLPVPLGSPGVWGSGCLGCLAGLRQCLLL